MDFKDPADHPSPAAPLSEAPGPAAWAVSTQFALNPPGSPGGQAGAHSAGAALDVCHVGVVLRVVLGVQLVVGLGLSFGAQGPADALSRWVQSAVVSLPASLLWLVLACAASRWLSRRRAAWQWAFAVALGVAVGALAQWEQAWLDQWVGGARTWAGWPMVPPMLTGAALAAVGLAWLKHRAHSQLPAHAAARLAELQARIRPHFLFNTLNTAIALVQIDPQRAEAVLEDLAELFRQALSSPSLRSTLAEEIDLARRYLGIEQLRFGDRVTVRWELDEAAAQAEVPALILQPLVENAVRHGIEANPLGGWIVVRTRVQGGRAVLTVSNSVPSQGPSQATAGHGIALRNVRQRLRLMHDVEADFDAGLQRASASADAGRQPPVYVVRIAVPLPQAVRGA
ncbi:MAG: histidine kinase [Proteobacteria bacterium]|uniref:sensor histidine kinase n=1 Tax=Aquabacterium sp. TaxID=1872578 RepID=UPI0035C769DD|nr:histidine kinase [Pseudomonadota bacterium]